MMDRISAADLRAMQKPKRRKRLRISELVPAILRELPPEPKEADIHKAVIAHWRNYGVPGSLVATIPNMGAFGQHGLTKGLPDLIVLSPTLGDLTGYLELKRVGGELSEAQESFSQLCRMRGIPWAVSYGRDEPIRILREWGAVKG